MKEQFKIHKTKVAFLTKFEAKTNRFAKSKNAKPILRLRPKSLNEEQNVKKEDAKRNIPFF